MFIQAPSIKKLPGFQGVFLECTFSLDAFDPSDFERLNIHFPSSLHRAIDKRKAEFLAGRFAAQQALITLGFEDDIIAIGENRQPLWPKAVIGSITHHKQTAGCALASIENTLAIGIDLEFYINQETADKIARSIISPQEQQRFAHLPLDFNQWLTIVFSAKESLFKTLYPTVQRYFGFLDAELVELNLETHSFTLALLKDLGNGIKEGMRYKGYLDRREHDVLTAIYF